MAVKSPALLTRASILPKAATAAAACLIGIRHPALAYVALAALSFGAAVAWPLIVGNVHAGEIVFDIAGTHGIHRNDLLSVVPFTAGFVFLGAALKHRQRLRGSAPGA